jgi:Zn-dependent protease
MNGPPRGSVRVGRMLGIDVYIHWSWAVVALFEIQTRKSAYASQAWNVAEYLALFLIVLLHEYGHALACRSVGGKADRILLWPLGGIAYVQPPQRPGALLWSIAAGPLVNLALFLGLLPVLVLGGGHHLSDDPHHFVVALTTINAVLFCFNMLPVYPLDGGQIVQALLWYVVGRARSLLVVSIIGLVGAGALLVGAVARGSLWFGAIAVFAGMRAVRGMQGARALAALAAAPRRVGYACPRCHCPPPVGEFWVCACGARFDMFATGGRCLRCQRSFVTTGCVDCQTLSPHGAFYPPAPAPTV